MAEVINGDQEDFLNVTNYTSHDQRSCTGPKPSKTTEIVTYSILMTFSLIGNSLVVAVFYRNKTAMRAAIRYFIVNMAISDLLIPAITLPEWISFVYHDDLWLVDGTLGTVLCKVVSIAWNVSTVVSILSMMAIAADRFHGILFPRRPPLFSQNRYRLVMAAIWITAVAFWAHYLYGATLVTDAAGLYCDVQWEPALNTPEVERITWMLVFILTSVSAILLTVFYSSIIIFLYKQKNNLNFATEVIKKRERRNRRITFMLVVIVIAFYAVWIPYHVVRFDLFYFKTSIKLSCFSIWITDKIPLLYPVVNPIVYYIFNEDYRRGCRSLFYCTRLCFRQTVPPQI